MFEPKVFGFEKPKTKTIIVSFRLDKEHDDMLQQLFTNLEVKPKKDTQTEKMLTFIEVVFNLSKGFNDFINTKKELEAKIAKLEHDLKHKKSTLGPLAIPGDYVKPFQEGQGNIAKPEPVFKDKPFRDTSTPAYLEAKYRYANEPMVYLETGKGLVETQSRSSQSSFKCLRNLSTKDKDQWLTACEVCEGQARNLFDMCHSTMKHSYLHQE